jgi:hypothetical protein
LIEQWFWIFDAEGHTGRLVSTRVDQRIQNGARLRHVIQSYTDAVRNLVANDDARLRVFVTLRRILGSREKPAVAIDVRAIPSTARALKARVIIALLAATVSLAVLAWVTAPAETTA